MTIFYGHLTRQHPDLGEFEDDDFVLQNEVQGVPEVTVPGACRTVCIDREFSNLDIATIISSDRNRSTNWRVMI